jgi:hypothetical protein
MMFAEAGLRLGPEGSESDQKKIKKRKKENV